MGSLTPISEFNYPELIQRLYNPEETQDTSKSMQLYKDIMAAVESFEAAVQNLEKTKDSPEKIKVTEETVNLANVILQTFYKHKKNESDLLIQHIGEKIGPSGKAAYDVIHRLVLAIAKIKNGQVNEDKALANLISIDRAAFDYVSERKEMVLPDDVMNLVVSYFVQSHPTEDTIALGQTSKKTRLQVIKAYRGPLYNLNIKTAAETINFASKYGKYLTFIDISSIKFTRKELVELISHLPNLNTFTANNCSLDDGCAAAIAAAKNLEKVTKLDLSRNNIKFRGTHAIANSKYLRLIELNLNNNKAGPKGAKAIADSENSKNLETLNMGYNGIGDDGTIAIMTSKHLKKVSWLFLAGNQITVLGAKAIADSENSKILTTLDLNDNDIGDSGTSALALSENVINLKWLFLRNNKIGNVGAIDIASSLYLNLTILDLSHNLIGDTEMVALAPSKCLINLTIFDLSHNQIGDKGAEAIAKHLINLTMLDLMANDGIKAAGRRALTSSENLKKTQLFLSPIIPRTIIGTREKG